MYCLEKLQRELAYYFDMDLRELPRVQDLLAAKGYTQVQKGDEIIKLESSQAKKPADKAESTLSQEIKDIIDSSPEKGRDMQIIGEANFTPQVVEYAHKNSKKVAIDKLDKAEAEKLGFKHPQDVRVTIDYQAINHTLNRHGADSALVQQSGQKAVDYTDIAEYRNIVKGADEKLFSKDDLGQDVILSFKQVNGYAVVVESIRKKGNELAFKSMYFENGSYKNSNAYKNAVDSQKANPSPAPYGYEPHADANTPPLKTDTEIIPQATHQDYNTFNQSLKDAHDFFKANNKDPYNDKLFNDVIKVANALDIRFWYQPNAVWMGGSYTYTLNRIMLRSKDFSAENAKTMLHELIHSVTSRAIYAYENKALRAKLSKEQIEAITELKNLYKEVSENNADKVWKKMATFRDEVENNKGKLYGLKNEHEMLAELANPTFREFLKEQNIFSKIVEAMAKIFSYVKDKLTGESVKSTNAQSELESILYKIMDSYTNPHAFTNEMSEHFGSRNFVDTTRYKEYIKDHKEKFDKDNYKGKHLFSFFDDSMNFYTKSALGGRENFFKTYINNAYFDEKDFDIVQKLKWQMMDPVKRPANFMELKTEKNAHIFQYIEQAQENNIKEFVKEYYGVSYEEFNNAFNGAMKDKHFYEAKPFTYKNYEDIPSKETAFLLALKPYFTSGLYKTLSEADFNVIKDNLYRILQDENLTYRNKPINEWFAKEWVEQDVKALQESFLYKLEQPNRFSDSSTPLNARISESGFNSQKGHQERTIKAEPSIAKTDEQIVAQDSNALLESTMKKFNYDERKAKDLLEWHKDSSPLTKDENGVPKVFYHGTGQKEFEPFQNKYVNFEVFKTTLSKQDDDFLKGHYFSSNIKIAKTYNNNNIYKVFLNAKNPLVIDFKGHTFNDYIDEAINNIPKSVQENIRDFYDSIIFKNIIDDSTQNGKKHPVADTIMVFNSNQIKHINNKGSYTDTKGNITKDKPKGVESTHTYFNESSPNIFHSNPHAGAGLLGGSVAGIEQDENGNITFNPEKFALGLLGGAVGSKAVAKGLEWRARKIAKSYPNIAKDNPALMQEIAKRDLQTYAMRNTHNALTRFLNKNKALDINTQLFAGEKALVNEAYAPHKARLAKAKELESKGADEIEIWEQTGWYKDKDKKWKFEISQRGGELDFSGLEFYTFSRDNRVKLSRILKDNELFTAYPSLKNLIVNFDYGMKDYKLGSYAKDDTKEITLNAKQLRDDESRLSTLYHELQHAIQDIEGFGFGYKEAENLRGISQESVERYAKQHGEVEARNVQNRLDNGYIGKIYSKQSLKDEMQKLKDVRLSLQKSDPDLAEVFDRRFKEYEKNYKNLGEYDIYNTREHPHKTMDTPLKNTIAESTIQGEALSKELTNKVKNMLESSNKILGETMTLKDRLLIDNKIKYSYLKEIAQDLPKPITKDDFLHLLKNKKYVNIQTPIKELEIEPFKAYEHLTQNSNKQNRIDISGAILPTLQNPLFITKDKKDTYYFYKPFKDEKGVLNIVSIAIPKSNRIRYKTSYIASRERMLKMINEYELVYEAF